MKKKTVNDDARPQRWWCDLRWITAAVVTLSIVWLAWGLFGPEPPIRVSRETTYFTEPLAADGLPDYRAVVLAMEGPIPPPEENAAAGLLQVCWPFGIDATDLPAVCTALGIPCEPPDEPLRAPYKDAASGVTQDMFDAAREVPWTSEDLPKLSAWLVAHEAALDRLVAAANRPRYWLPSPSLLSKKNGLLLDLELSDAQELREVARTLRCRAMWHLGEGRHAEAWKNILAMYRLSRSLVAPERRAQFFITWLVAVSCELMADGTVTDALLADDALPPELLAEIRRDLDALALPADFTSVIQMERAGVIDLLIFLGCRESGGRAGRAARATGLFGWDDLTLLLLRTRIDWNDVLRRANEAFESWESASGLSTFAERRASLERAVSELETRATSWESAGQVLMLVCSRGARSDCVGSRLSCLTIRFHAAGVDAITRVQARFILAHTAVALAAWRLDHGPDGDEYPDRLEDLVPRYLSVVPIDPFSDKPLIYERRDDGYVLASVGANCVYDGGNDVEGWIVNSEWQDEQQDVSLNDSDLVVRMPVPKRLFIRPAAP